MFAIKEIDGIVSARAVRKDFDLDEGETLVDDIPKMDSGDDLIMVNGKLKKRKRKEKVLTDIEKLESKTGMTVAKIKVVLGIK